MALVVVYRVWLGRVSGGVDVFFLLSGFLITGQVPRALDRGGPQSARRVGCGSVQHALPLNAHRTPRSTAWLLYRLLGAARDGLPVYGSGEFTIYGPERLREPLAGRAHDLRISLKG